MASSSGTDQDPTGRRAEEPPCHFEVRGDLDRHAAEALRLEIRQLAKRHGLDVSAVRIEPSEGPQSG